MGNAKWTWLAVGYQTGLAYAVALVVYQLGSLFTGKGFGIGTLVALVLLVGFLYMLFRPYKDLTSSTNHKSNKVENISV